MRRRFGVGPSGRCRREGKPHRGTPPVLGDALVRRRNGLPVVTVGAEGVVAIRGAPEEVDVVPQVVPGRGRPEGDAGDREGLGSSRGEVRVVVGDETPEDDVHVPDGDAVGPRPRVSEGPPGEDGAGGRGGPVTNVVQGLDVAPPTPRPEGGAGPGVGPLVDVTRAAGQGPVGPPLVTRGRVLRQMTATVLPGVDVLDVVVAPGDP